MNDLNASSLGPFTSPRLHVQLISRSDSDDRRVSPLLSESCRGHVLRLRTILGCRAKTPQLGALVHPAKLSVRLRLSRDEVGIVRSSSEEFEDGEDTTMLVGRLRQSELLEDLRYMGLDRSIGDEESLGQSAI